MAANTKVTTKVAFIAVVAYGSRKPNINYFNT